MSGIHVLQIDHVLDTATLERIRQEMGAARGGPATVLGLAPQHRVASSVRKPHESRSPRAPTRR